jgi:hypothetical protein
MIFEIKPMDTGMEPKVFWGTKRCQGHREKYPLYALILMGAWCEAVLITTVS